MLAGIARRHILVSRTVASIAAACALGVGTAAGQPAEPSLPFAAGEVLEYRVKIPVFRTVGRAVFRVEGPIRYRGVDVLVLRSDVTTKWGPIRGQSASASWFDPEQLHSLRFEKDERQPGSRDEESVDLYPAERRFEHASGHGGDMPTNAPLDELSFIYFLRTVELLPDSAIRFTRHYEASRNPVSVRLIKREIVETGMGSESALLIEMRVRDPRHYKGVGVIRIHLSDDERRVPLRIESSAPATGKVTLVLERYAAPPAARTVANVGR